MSLVVVRGSHFVTYPVQFNSNMSTKVQGERTQDGDERPLNMTFFGANNLGFLTAVHIMSDISIHRSKQNHEDDVKRMLLW
jgi:hypothetical protein